MNEVKNTAHDVYDTIEEDFHELENIMRQLCLSVMLAGRTLYRQAGCPRRDTVPRQGSLEEGLVGSGRNTLEEMKHMAETLGEMVVKEAVGPDAVTTIGTIEQEALEIKNKLKARYEALVGWWKDLTRPADCKDAATLGIDRAVDAVGLACSGIVGLCEIPGELQTAKDIVNNCSSLWPEVKAHWEDVWRHFIDTMEKLCNHVYIDLPDVFKDLDAGDTVVFSASNKNFLSVCEHPLLNSEGGPCISYSMSVCHSASRMGERFCARIFWQITQFHLRRPMHDYIELMEQHRKTLPQ